MKLSVIIVNYNVQYFLEQCLLSVEKAMVGVDTEVWMVDNNSVDGSVAMTQQKFPWVKWIANKENTGFSKANNQAMKLSSGEYFLLLNPDTVVEEDTFRKVVAFMDEHQDAGGLGVKMVDGKGNFLPESKRGLPTPQTSFFKIFGISRLFPKSKLFNRYHLGNLCNDETHEIEILSGAFMLMRKSALDKVGLLDEAFFMYGEDIDLSWRIIQGGWKNYYFPGTRIIHYKGESTKKGSLNYVYVFYNAMVIFAKKHYSENNARLFSFFIHIAIWMRAGVAILSRFLKRMFLPVLDMTLVLSGLFLVKEFYASSQHKIYDNELLRYAFLSFALIWCIAAWLGGGYDKPIRPLKVIKPVLIGSAVVLIGYSLLPESLRFSRAIVLMGSIIAITSFFVDRIVLNFLLNGESGLEKSVARRLAIIGSHDELQRVKSILTQIQQEPGYIANVSPNEILRKGDIGNMPQLDEIVRIHKIDQVIFCAADVSSTDIIGAMSSIADKTIEFKIAPPESLYIIGSGSIETSGDTFMMDVNSVSLIQNKRTKRIFDLCFAFVFLVLWLLSFLFVKKPLGLLVNCFYVIVGQRSWVGYSQQGELDHKQLPSLKPGILDPLMVQPVASHTPDNAQKLNVLYAKDYRWMNDFSIVWKGKKFIGQSPCSE